MEFWAAGTPGSLCHAGVPDTFASRSTAAASVKAPLNPVATKVESVLGMIATPVQPVFDPVAFVVESLFGTISARAVHALVDALAPCVEVFIDTFTTGIETFVDAFAAYVEALVGPVAAIHSHRGNCHQGQHTDRNTNCTFLHGFTPDSGKRRPVCLHPNNGAVGYRLTWFRNAMSYLVRTLPVQRCVRLPHPGAQTGAVGKKSNRS
jgi:hypothetical protein